MAFYFFTEPSKLSVQMQNQAFGAIDENNYRLNNLFTTTSNAKAYAITGGNVLVQPIIGSTTLVNIVLKPVDQPDLNLPKIDYIIYKGVEKSSLISAAKVASPSTNDLTRKIWESHADLLVSMPDAPPEPLAAEALGFRYAASETGDYKALDSDALDIAFYNNQNTLFPVEAGDHIGDFNSANLGCLIALEKIGLAPTFKLARELDSQISFTALGSTPTTAELFRRKHDKEDVLAYLDSAAFFSAFDGVDVQVTSNGTTFEEKLPEAFYTDVTEKHFNKNTVYFDIRNENLDSFNYYENYSDLLKLDLVGADTYEEVDYYRDKWPLLAVKDTEFDVTNTDKTLGVSLYKGDNEFPQFFLKKGKLLNVDLEDKKNVALRFLQHEIDVEEENYKMVEKFQILKSDTDVIKSNYFQLRYIKRYATPDAIYKGVALKNESFLDNLFPIFDMKLPYVNSGNVDVKMFTDASYVDKTNINEIDFTVNLGIARDNQGISFMALPEIYNVDELQAKEKPPFYSEQTFGEGTFFDYFNKKLTNNKIRESVFEDGDDNYEFLAFAETILEEAVVEPSTANIDDDVSLESSTLALEYDFENFNIFSLTNDEYTQLEIVKNTEFTVPYKVYLGIANTEPLTADDNQKSTTFYALRGLKENGAGEIVPHEHVSNIKVFAKDDLYNWDSDNETGKVLKAYWVDENDIGITKLPFEEDTIRIHVETENAIGKNITVQVWYNRTGIDSKYKELSSTIQSNQETHEFQCTPEFFKSNYDNNNIKEFYLYIKVGDGKFNYYSENEGDMLRIHAVRFIPDLMQHKSWLKGLTAQNLWFTSAAQSTPDVNVEVGFVTMSWIRSFPRTEDDYQNVITSEWNASNSYDSLRSEVTKMIAYSNVSGNPTIAELPTVEGENKPFGDFSLNVVNDINTGKTLPLIEHFYYKNKAYDFGFGIEDPLDDLYATLANFNFRVAAKGFLSLESGITYINITKIGVYVRDSFDFTNPGWSDQDLGAWNFINKTVSKIAGGLDYSIENSDYNNWRNDHNKGGDFRIYTDVIEVAKTLKITLS